MTLRETGIVQKWVTIPKCLIKWQSYNVVKDTEGSKLWGLNWSSTEEKPLKYREWIPIHGRPYWESVGSVDSWRWCLILGPSWKELNYLVAFLHVHNLLWISPCSLSTDCLRTWSFWKCGLHIVFINTSCDSLTFHDCDMLLCPWLMLFTPLHFPLVSAANCISNVT